MKLWTRAFLAVLVSVTFLAATHYAIHGRNAVSHSEGYLGTDTAGVEGDAECFGCVGVVGRTTSGNEGSLGWTYAGVRGVTTSVNSGFSGVSGTHGTGNWGNLGTSMYGVEGRAVSTVSGSSGVYGYGLNGVRGIGTDTGVIGSASEADGTGVYGGGWNGVGVHGYSNEIGVLATAADANGIGLEASVTSGGTGHAGLFFGHTSVHGTLDKTAGSFKIDHPTDPENKYLYHSFVESPDMKNLYDGIAVLDGMGEAVVELPGWFEALNRDFRYQLTCIGEFANVYVADKIHENRFRIAGGKPGMEVSWLVTGIRRDPYAEAHRIAVEEEKPPQEKGRYLFPELYGKRPEFGVYWQAQRR